MIGELRSSRQTAVHAIAARMAAQRGLGLFRAAEESSRSTVEAGQPPCASACAVEALPSSQTAEQPASREAAVQDEQLPRAVSATGFGGNTRTKKRIFEKRLRVRRAHPWATPPCKRLILGALRGSVGAIHQYFALLAAAVWFPQRRRRAARSRCTDNPTMATLSRAEALRARPSRASASTFRPTRIRI